MDYNCCGPYLVRVFGTPYLRERKNLLSKKKTHEKDKLLPNPCVRQFPPSQVRTNCSQTHAMRVRRAASFKLTVGRPSRDKNTVDTTRELLQNSCYLTARSYSNPRNITKSAEREREVNKMPRPCPFTPITYLARPPHKHRTPHQAPDPGTNTQVNHHRKSG